MKPNEAIKCCKQLDLISKVTLQAVLLMPGFHERNSYSSPILEPVDFEFL